MTKQLPLFQPPEPTADDRLNAELAEMRLARMERDRADREVRDAAELAPILSREQRRSRRKREVHATTISVKRMTKRELELGRLLYPPIDEQDDVPPKPRTRADCKGGPRPCPFVSCEHHLFLDVSARTGAIKLNFPDLEPWELTESCALDVADREGTTLEAVGAIMNLTRERVRQIEVKALAKVGAAIEMRGLRGLVDEDGPARKRRLPLLEQPQEAEDQAEPGEYEGAHGEPGFDAEYFASDELDAE